ncbi:MAG: hypothetical protein ACOYNR_03515 [Blastocatellia bacterium]
MKTISKTILPFLLLGSLLRSFGEQRSRRRALILCLSWGLTGGLGTSVLGRTTSSATIVPPTSRVESTNWVASGLDAQGTPWLRSNRGVEGHYRALSSQTTHLDLSTIDPVRPLQKAPLGTVEMGQVPVSSAASPGLFFTWRTHAGAQLTLTSRPFNSEQRQIEIEYRAGETQPLQRAMLLTKSGIGSATNQPDLREAEAILEQAASQAALRQLAQESVPFLSGEALRLLPVWRSFGTSLMTPSVTLEGGVSDCAYHVTDCLVAMVAYGAGMSALVGSCGFTFGWGCAGALIAHPVLAGATAIYCGRAGHTCSQ